MHEHAGDANRTARGRTREPGHNAESFKRQFALCVAVGVALTAVFFGVAVAVGIGVARGARRRAGPNN